MHRFISLLAATSALVAGLPAGLGAAQAQTQPRLVHVTLAGLPAGLDISLRAFFPVCDGTIGLGAVSPQVPVTAVTEYVLESIWIGGLNGYQAFSGRPVPTYRAEPFRVPINGDCPQKRAEVVAHVSGVDGGQPGPRGLHLLDVFPTGDDFTVRIEPRASTLLIRDGNGQTLSTLTRNTFQSVTALLQSPGKAPGFSGSPGFVNTPSLALQFPAQPQNGAPLPDVVVRFFGRRFGNQIRPCIQKDGQVACAQLLATGAVGSAMLDGFECLVTFVPGGGLDSQGRTTATFIFKLPLSLQVGQMELSVSANDVDFTTYTVNGAQQSLDLLPWRPLNRPIFIQ